MESFFSDTDCTKEQIDRIQYLVGHHHTLKEIDGPDHQILIEADFIANALEKGYSKKNIENFMKVFVRTKAGKQLMNDLFETTSGPDGCR